MLLQGERRKLLVVIILSVQKKYFIPLESVAKGGKNLNKVPSILLLMFKIS